MRSLEYRRSRIADDEWIIQFPFKEKIVDSYRVDPLNVGGAGLLMMSAIVVTVLPNLASNK